MKKFIFSLEKVLNVKENNEILAKQRYAKVLQEKLKYSTENKELLSNYFKDITKSYRSTDSIKGIDTNDMLYEASYIQAVELQIEANNKKIIKIEEQLKPLFEELVKATIEKKKYEKLKEKEYDEWKVAKNKHETAILDEIALNMFSEVKRYE